MPVPEIHKMVKKWRTDGASVRPPTDMEAIRAFENRHGVVLPMDFAEYLLEADGMREDGMDSDLFSFWQLSRIRSLCVELAEPHYETYRNFAGAESFFCFADWMMRGTLFCIQLTNNRVSESPIIALGPRFLPCKTFTEFVRMYLRDPTSLLG